MKMSILITGATLLIAIALLAVNLVYITFALYDLGVSGLFKTIEEVFEGKNKGQTAEDYLIYAGLISASVFLVFAIIIIVAIVIAVLGAPEEGVAVLGAGAAEEAGGAELLPGVGNLISGAVGTVLMVVLVLVVFASTASGALCFIAASEIRKDPKYNGKKELRTAYTYSIIAGITGIGVVVFAIVGIIGYLSLRYYQRRQRTLAMERIKEAKKEERIEAGRGLIRLIQERAAASAV